MPVLKARPNTSEWFTSTNPRLRVAEIGLELDTGKFKVGDGRNYWNDLGYFIEKGIVRLHDFGVVDVNMLVEDSSVLYVPKEGEIIGPIVLRDVVLTDRDSMTVVIGRDEQVIGDESKPALAYWNNSDIFDTNLLAAQGDIPLPTTMGVVRAGLSGNGSTDGKPASRWKSLTAYGENEGVIMAGSIWSANPGGTSSQTPPDFAANLGGSVSDGEDEASAFKIIRVTNECDLKFTAKTPGSGGNDITIELASPIEDTEEITVVVEDNAIRVELAGIAPTPGNKAFVETSFAGANNDLLFRASSPGSMQNYWTVVFSDGGNDHLWVRVINFVPVYVGNTAADVIAAIGSLYPGYINVELAPGNDGSGVIVPSPGTGTTYLLSGGSLPTSGTHISTVNDIISAIEANEEANALVDVEIVGDGNGSSIPHFVIPFSLEGGGLLVWNDLGYDLPTVGSGRVLAYIAIPVAS